MKTILENWDKQEDGRWRVITEGDGIDILGDRYEDHGPGFGLTEILGFAVVTRHISEDEYAARLHQND